MATQITTKNLSLVTYRTVPVVTTEMLALLYKTEQKHIRQNYSRNENRFVRGKHFYKVENEELNQLRASQRGLQISSKTRSIILWTERGAARHAKMLETDKAWEVFEQLEDCYFNQRQRDLFDTDSAITVTIPREGRWLVCYRNRQHQIINIDGKDCVDGEYIRKLRRDVHLLVQTLQDFGYRTLVMSGDASPTRLDKPLIENTDQTIR